MPNLGPTSWIRLPDFAELSLWIEVVNTITRMAVPDHYAIELSEIGEKSLTLKLPVRSCALGHFLSIRIKMRKKLPWNDRLSSPLSPADAAESDSDSDSELELELELDDEIEFTAKVIEVQPIDEKSKSVSLVMHQFPEDRWKELIALISGHQREINRVVAHVKGN